MDSRYPASLRTLAAIAAVLLASTAFADQAEVAFDESHGQRFLIGSDGPLQLSNLAGVLKDQKLRLRSTQAVLTTEALQASDALVISGPFEPITPDESQAILAFVKGGGRLCVMLHIGPPVADLLHQLGVSISNGVIRETAGVIGEDAINFEVSHLEKTSLFDGIDSFNIYGAWALLTHGHHAGGVAKTGLLSWIDLNGDRVFTDGDAVQEFDVVVEGTYGNGRFVVFGDDAMFQNQFLQGNNRKLAENLGRWLSGGKPLSEEPQIASDRTGTYLNKLN